MAALRIGWFILLVLGSGPPAAASRQIYRHTGSVLDIANDGTTISLAEVGPWREGRGVTEIIKRTIRIPSSRG